METRERRARRQSGIPALLRSFLLAHCVPLVAEQAFQGRGDHEQMSRRRERPGARCAALGLPVLLLAACSPRSLPSVSSSPPASAPAAVAAATPTASAPPPTPFRTPPPPSNSLNRLTMLSAETGWAQRSSTEPCCTRLVASNTGRSPPRSYRADSSWLTSRSSASRARGRSAQVPSQTIRTLHR